MVVFLLLRDCARELRALDDRSSFFAEWILPLLCDSACKMGTVDVVSVGFAMVIFLLLPDCARELQALDERSSSFTEETLPLLPDCACKLGTLDVLSVGFAMVIFPLLPDCAGELRALDDRSSFFPEEALPFLPDCACKLGTLNVLSVGFAMVIFLLLPDCARELQALDEWSSNFAKETLPVLPDCACKLGTLDVLSVVFAMVIFPLLPDCARELRPLDSCFDFLVLFLLSALEEGLPPPVFSLFVLCLIESFLVQLSPPTVHCAEDTLVEVLLPIVSHLSSAESLLPSHPLIECFGLKSDFLFALAARVGDFVSDKLCFEFLINTKLLDVLGLGPTWLWLSVVSLEDPTLLAEELGTFALWVLLDAFFCCMDVLNKSLSLEETPLQLFLFSCELEEPRGSDCGLQDCFSAAREALLVLICLELTSCFSEALVARSEHVEPLLEDFATWSILTECDDPFLTWFVITDEPDFPFPDSVAGGSNLCSDFLLGEVLLLFSSTFILVSPWDLALLWEGLNLEELPVVCKSWESEFSFICGLDWRFFEKHSLTWDELPSFMFCSALCLDLLSFVWLRLLVGSWDFCKESSWTLLLFFFMDERLRFLPCGSVFCVRSFKDSLFFASLVGGGAGKIQHLLPTISKSVLEIWASVSVCLSFSGPVKEIISIAVLGLTWQAFTPNSFNPKISIPLSPYDS